jgi:hypothetical protein
VYRTMKRVAERAAADGLRPLVQEDEEPNEATPGASASSQEAIRGPELKRIRTEAPKEHQRGGYVCEFVEVDDEIEGEIWAKVPESYGGNAYVSNFGRYKSCVGVVTTPTPSKGGNVQIKIGGKTFYLHRVILEAFGVVPPSSAHEFANHKDLNPSKNRLENLEWCTQQENIRHPYATNANRKSNAHKTLHAGAREAPGRGVGGVRELQGSGAAARSQSGEHLTCLPGWMEARRVRVRVRRAERAAPPRGRGVEALGPREDLEPRAARGLLRSDQDAHATS